jgi:hypothetical protein
MAPRAPCGRHGNARLHNAVLCATMSAAVRNLAPSIGLLLPLITGCGSTGLS